LAIQPARATDAVTITREKTLGCIAREAIERYMSMAMQDDAVAMRKFLAVAILIGECRLFVRGDRVFIEETWLRAGLIHVRPEGNLPTYWLSRESIRNSN
jgi:hypothetical protein